MWSHTLFESGNQRQKIEPVPLSLLRASRNFPDVKTRNKKKFYNWTFIRFGKQMDRRFMAIFPLEIV